MSDRHIWTPQEVELLPLLYVTHTAETIADLLGLTRNQVARKVQKMRLKKSREWRSQNARETGNGQATRFRPGNVPWIKGTRGMVKPSSSTFKPGNRSHTQRPVGAESVRDGVLWKKVSEGAVESRFDWVAVHRLVWERHNGPVPTGHVVAFRPGMATAVADEITIDRLELITRAQMLARHTIASYPTELRSAMSTLKKLRQVIADKGAAAP